jgi:NADP-dependent 3-hydroxy acid dehydrogenase YdfG
VIKQITWHVIKPDFTGKTVLITGASSVIGEQLCYKIAEMGAEMIVLTARRTHEL